MLRRLAGVIFNVLAALSLVLCVAAAALWVRSYYATDTLRWSDPRPPAGWRRTPAWQCWMSGAGQVLYLRVVPADPAAPEFGHEPLRHVTDPPPRASVAEGQWVVREFRGAAGFQYGAGSGLGYRGRAWAVPLWFVVLVLALPPAAWAVRFVRRRRRRRRVAAGRCIVCGYDLTANVSGMCPECGTAIAKGAMG